MRQATLTQHVALKVLLAKMRFVSGPTYSPGAQLPLVLLPKGLPQVVNKVTATLSWLLAALLSGLVRLAVAVSSPAVVPFVVMVYILQPS
jgi:hypothetical protein